MRCSVGADREYADVKPSDQERHARAYRDALDRLLNGTAVHPSHAGRKVRVTPTSVAREAGKSRNPLYSTHVDILGEIARLASDERRHGFPPDRIGQLEQEVSQLRSELRKQAVERRKLASENLTLMHRARVAEERLEALRGHRLTGTARALS